MAKAVDDSHDYGSDEITDVKLRLVEKYLSAYATALKGKFDQLWYIDAFAGTGVRTIRHEARNGDFFGEGVAERVERKRGSATIGLEVKPEFDRLIFMDQRPRHCDALEAIRDQHPDRSIAVVRGDANQTIQRAASWSGWKRTRAVMFLDPYGMTVDWATLEAIAATKAIDVWYLFSLEGLYRNAARSLDDVDPGKAAALTRLTGGEDWKRQLYAPRDSHIVSMFPEEAEQMRREADVAGLEKWFTERLRTLFPLVLEPYALPVQKKPQRFSLYLMLANDDARAKALAKRIGDQILTSGK